MWAHPALGENGINFHFNCNWYWINDGDPPPEVALNGISGRRVYCRLIQKNKKVSFNISLLTISEKNARRLIGLYELEEFGGLPGFRIIIITKNVHKTGKYMSLIMELNMWVSMSRVF